jgi:hypothetical protein
MSGVRTASIEQVRAGKNGRLVRIDDDIFDIAKRLREIHPSLGLDWNDTAGYFRVTQALHDGSKHVVLTCRELTPALVDRVRKITHHDYDVADELDRMDREYDKDRESRLTEQTGEMGERLHQALRKDMGFKPRVFLPRGVDV